MIIKLICSNNNTRLILSSFHRFEGGKDTINAVTKETRIESQKYKFDGSNSAINSTIIFQLTTGMVGLKGATRSSIYGAENVYKKFIERLKIGKLYNNTFILLVKGFGPTRNYLLHKLAQLKISKIKDITTYPHNGCRLPKSLRK